MAILQSNSDSGQRPEEEEKNTTHDFLVYNGIENGVSTVDNNL